MPSGYTLDSFLRQVSRAADDGTLHEVLSLDPTAKHVPLLQPGLQDFDDKQLESIVENHKFFDNDWPALETAIARYLVYVRDVDPWSLLNSIDLMISFYEGVSVALNNRQFNEHLLSLTEETSALLIRLCKLVDCQTMKLNNRTNDYPRSSYMTTLLLKSLNNIRGGDLDRYRLQALMTLSASLSNLYIYIGSPMLCNNVFSNINVLNLDCREISVGQLVRYRFVLGKFHLMESNFCVAFHHFEWCLNHSQTNPKCWPAILKYLIPCGLLVGKVVDLQAVADHPELLAAYKPLARAYKDGDLHGFFSSLKEDEEASASFGSLVGFERVRILIFRNLVYRIWKEQGGKLRFADVKKGLALSVLPEDGLGPVDDELVESVLVSLIDGNLMKAKLTASQTIVMRKEGSFPPVHEIYKVKFMRNDKEQWLDGHVK